MKNDPSLIKEKVQGYICQFVYVDKEKIRDNSLIFKEGFMDSMGLISLITFLEEEFAIKIVNIDLTEANFESINSVTDFVIRKSEI